MLCCLIDNLSLLLPGFRFHLTNEELVLHYISPKVLNFPLVAFVILEIDNICKYDPWDLPSTLYGERNFFNTREVKNDRGNRFSRAIGKDKKITISGVLQRLIGMKKTLVFYKGKPSNGSRTNWTMHKYCISVARQP
ncbi:NAC domain-containing protein 83-like [Ipomoea triloba]|uniref:NAC domain-containing protein 83-like n=1 Tax=Ipomoea triloba TaxID=35885 RepID=UPI00125E7044|nr:NAC domain-containing protein 83-like [Ipomoea triloba]